MRNGDGLIALFRGRLFHLGRDLGAGFVKAADRSVPGGREKVAKFAVLICDPVNRPQNTKHGFAQRHVMRPPVLGARR